MEISKIDVTSSSILRKNLNFLKQRDSFSLEDMAIMMGYENKSTMSKLLSGKQPFTLDMIDGFANLFHVTSLDLLDARLEEKVKMKKMSKEIIDLYSFKELGLSPETNMLVTDDILVTGDDKDYTIDTVMAGFYYDAMDLYGYSQLLIYRSLSGKIGLGTAQMYLKRQNNKSDLEYMSIYKDVNTLSEGMTEECFIKETVDLIKGATLTGVLIFLEIEKDNWHIVHDLNSEDEIISSCPYCE